MSDQAAPILIVESDGPIRIVTLNDPARLNAFTTELHDAFVSVWQKLSEDEAARAVVLTGAGRAFSAGGDIPGFVDAVNREARRRRDISEAGRLVTEMLRFRLPVIAAVNGPAVGLGASVAAMSDIVVMSDQAFIADTHVNVGLVAGDGGPVTWPAMMSILHAKEYLLTGDRIAAEDALRLGLANRVVPEPEVMSTALEFARRIAALPPQAVQDTKRAINIHLQTAAHNVLPFALAAEELSFTTQDVADRARSFMEKDR